MKPQSSIYSTPPEYVLWEKTIVPMNKSADGETVTSIAVTQERSFFGVWLKDSNIGTVLLLASHTRSRAIERAVELSLHRPSDLALNGLPVC